MFKKIYLIKSNLDQLETFVEIVVVANSEEQASKMIPYFECYYDSEQDQEFKIDRKERVLTRSVEMSQTGDFIIPEEHNRQNDYYIGTSNIWAKNVNDLTIAEVGTANDNLQIGQVISAYFHDA